MIFMTCFSQMRFAFTLHRLFTFGKAVLSYYQWCSQGLSGWATCPSGGPDAERERKAEKLGKIRKLDRNLMKEWEEWKSCPPGTVRLRPCFLHIFLFHKCMLNKLRQATKINPRLTKRGGCNLRYVFVFVFCFCFFGCSRTRKTVIYLRIGHIGNLFYIICGHFHEKNWGYHLTLG